MQGYFADGARAGSPYARQTEIPAASAAAFT